MAVLIPDGSDGSSSENFALNLDFLDLNGSFGSFKNGVQVKVRGLSDTYVINKSFPLLVTEDSFTNIYFLQNTSDTSKVLICPQSFLTKADDTLDLGSFSPADFDFSLNGRFGSFKDGWYVKTKFKDKIYKVKSSFLMLNSDNVFIICYCLSHIDNDFLFYCPHTFLIRMFEPETVSNIIGNGGSGNSGNGSGHSGGSVPPPVPIPPDSGGGSHSGDIVT